MSVTLAQASTIVDVALKKGRETNCAPLTVAVLDAGGHLVAFKREDRSGIMRFDIAFGKAWGALGMGFGSRELSERGQKNPTFFGILATVSSGPPRAGAGRRADQGCGRRGARRGRDFGRHFGQGRGLRDRGDRGGELEGGGGGVTNAASAVPVIVPSPLVGEGYSEAQRRRMGEGSSRKRPLTQPRLLNRRRCPLPQRERARDAASSLAASREQQALDITLQTAPSRPRAAATRTRSASPRRGCSSR